MEKVNSMPSLYIVLEKEIPNIDIYVNGNFLSKHSKELQKLAKKSGVPSLISFFSTSPEEIADLMEKDVESLKGSPTYTEKWFAAEDGLRTVNALLENLGGFKGDRDKVEAELQEFGRVLQLAQSNDIRWHLAIDY